MISAVWGIPPPDGTLSTKPRCEAPGPSRRSTAKRRLFVMRGGVPVLFSKVLSCLFADLFSHAFVAQV